MSAARCREACILRMGSSQPRKAPQMPAERQISSPHKAMATHWRKGRNWVAALSILAGGFPVRLAAEKPGDDAAIPPIFAVPAAEAAPAPQAADLVSSPAGRGESTDATLQLISEGLPKFDPRLAAQASGPGDDTSAAAQSAPIFMKPFTVFDAPILELTKPQEDLLARIEGTEPLFRAVGKNMTSELTFVDLAKAYNWRPFSVDPPPAVSVRFTISW
jgi:hypothetical protein